MNRDTDHLSIKKIKSRLINKNLNIFLYNTIDSTNTQAKRLINKKFIDNTIIISEEQTNGKGTIGRNFFSPAKSGIYMSIILKLDTNNINLSLITISVAVAIHDSIKQIANIDTHIKWVNDLYFKEKKVCGILAENINSTRKEIANIIIGIGINCYNPVCDFPKDIKNKAGFLNINNVSRNKIISSIINNIVFNNYLFSKSTIKRYKEYCLTLGQTIFFKKNENIKEATAIDINEHGNLIVIDKNGNIDTLTSKYQSQL